MESTLTIGIPAFNEQANIKNLLVSVLGQKQEGFVLEKIIVVNDGSTDKTAAIVKSFSDPRIELVEFEERRGVMAAQNEIVSRAQSSILVLLDADVLPTANNFLQEIAKPILADPQVGLVGADTQSAEPRGFLEGVTAFSHEFKSHIYKQINNGNNLYLCHGRARAFSRDFYTQIRWQDPYAEDAFSYLLCTQKGLRFVFAPNASVLFRSPATSADYVKQSRRFLDGIKLMGEHFPKNFVAKEYHIPVKAAIASASLYFFKNPIKYISFLPLWGYARFFSTYRPLNQAYFEISESTKKVI